MNKILYKTPEGMIVWEAHTLTKNAKRAVQKAIEGWDGRNISLSFDINQTIAVNSDFVAEVSKRESALEEITDQVYSLFRPYKELVRKGDGTPDLTETNELKFNESSTEFVLNATFRDEIPIYENGQEVTGHDRRLHKGTRISMEGELDVRINERDGENETTRLVGNVRFYPRAIFVHSRPEIKRNNGYRPHKSK